MKNNGSKKGRGLSALLIIAFAALFCVSAYKVGSQLLTEHREQSAFNELVADISADRPTRQAPATRTPKPAHETETPDMAAPDASTTPAPGSPEPAQEEQPTPSAITPEPTPTSEPTPTPEPTEVPPMLEAYARLYQRNHDIFGWITIEGTKVDFPVMHTPRDPEYYLHKSFNRTYAYSGVPFMDSLCFPGCGNYIIYGHHMKNGTMFAPIVGYAEEAFWQEHPVIYFDTLYEMGAYEIVGVFYSRVFAPEETDVFRYYLYNDLRDPANFADYMAQVRAAALYDTGVVVEYGDQLITLSTCEYSEKDNRFIVVARKID